MATTSPFLVPIDCALVNSPKKHVPFLRQLKKGGFQEPLTQTTFSVGVQAGLNQEHIQVPEQLSDAGFGRCVHLPFPYKRVNNFCWPCCRWCDATPAQVLQTKSINLCIT